MKKQYDLSQPQPIQPTLPPRKQGATIRLEPSVAFYFGRLAKESGLPYQALINHVLREYVSRNLAPWANWGSSAADSKDE